MMNKFRNIRIAAVASLKLRVIKANYKWMIIPSRSAQDVTK